MRQCSKDCLSKNKLCMEKDCRMWISYEEDNNCCLISIHKNGPLTLEQVGDRLKISAVRTKQIQDISLIKIKKGLSGVF